MCIYIFIFICKYIGKYGKHLSASEVRAKYAPLATDLKKIIAFFEQAAGSVVDVNKIGNMLHITAPRASIEVCVSCLCIFIYVCKHMHLLNFYPFHHCYCHRNDRDW